MGREIKFRIYLQGKFHYWGYLDEGEGLMFVSPPSGGGLTIEEAQKRSEQLTGLKDHKGVEAYHKDICTDGQTNYLIEWDEKKASFYLVPINTKGYWLTMNMLSVYWIIGNFHENPELSNG